MADAVSNPGGGEHSGETEKQWLERMLGKTANPVEGEPEVYSWLIGDSTGLIDRAQAYLGAGGLLSSGQLTSLDAFTAFTYNRKLESISEGELDAVVGGRDLTELRRFQTELRDLRNQAIYREALAARDENSASGDSGPTG